MRAASPSSVHFIASEAQPIALLLLKAYSSCCCCSKRALPRLSLLELSESSWPKIISPSRVRRERQLPAPIGKRFTETLAHPAETVRAMRDFRERAKESVWSRMCTIDVSALPHRSRDSFPHSPLHPSGLSARYAQRALHSKEWNKGSCEPFVSRSSPVPAGPQVRLPRLAMPRRTRLRVPRQGHQLHRGRARKGSSYLRARPDGKVCKS